MKEYTLTPEQNAEIQRYIDNAPNGGFDKEFDFGNLFVVVSGYIESDGYREDDYFNGTGAYVETRREVNVTLTAYDEDGEVDIVSNVA